jgi:hypothetical protein
MDETTRHLCRVLMRDQVDRDEIAVQLLRHRDERGQGSGA